MLAAAAAGSVLELEITVHGLGRFCFFIIWKVLVFAVAVVLAGHFSSCRYLLFDRRFHLDSDGPDKAQQFASYGGDDLALVLACRR